MFSLYYNYKSKNNFLANFNLFCFVILYLLTKKKISRVKKNPSFLYIYRYLYFSFSLRAKSCFFFSKRLSLVKCNERQILFQKKESFQCFLSVSIYFFYNHHRHVVIIINFFVSGIPPQKTPPSDSEKLSSQNQICARKILHQR